MTEHTKLNIGETSYQVSKKFIDDMENLFVSAKENVDLPEECEEGCEMGMCGSWIHTDCYKAIKTMRNNPIYDFHLKRTEMMVRPDNKKLTDKEKLAVKSKKGCHKYMRCPKCRVVITKKEEKAHYKRKKCVETFKRRIHNASITIQRWYRYWVHRGKYLKQQKKIVKKQNKKEKKEKKQNKKIDRRSARKIQAIWRGYIVRKNNLIRKDIVNNVVNTAIAYAIEQEERAIKPVMRVIKIKRKKLKKEKLLEDGSREKKEGEWTMAVHTEEEGGFDFTFTRHFVYATYKTTYGYKFYFKNQADYETAKDMTMYNMVYKDESLYKWVYEDIEFDEPEPAELTIDEMLRKYEEAYYEIADITIPTMPQLKKKFGDKAIQEKLVYVKEISITYNNKLIKALELNKLYSQKIQNEGTEEHKRQLASCVRGINREQMTANGAVKRRLKAIHNL